MIKRVVITLVCLLVLLGLIFAIKGLEIHSAIKKFESMVTPPQYVSAAKAKQVAWQDKISAVGSLVAVNGVDVSSQVPGKIIKINFHSGDMVKKGQVLVNLDDSVDQKQLASYQAQYLYYKSSYQRQSSLFKTNAAAKSALDEALSNMQQAKANVEREQQLIAQKAIKAPFDGKLGIRQVNLGEYVNAGAAMVTLQSLDPLYVNFSVPEQAISKLKIGQKIGVTVDSYPGKEYTGKLTAISSRVTVDTRSINLQATIPNHAYKLVPGSYAQVAIYMPKKQQVTVVPNTAITYRLYGNSVYIVTDTGKKNKKGQPILEAQLRYVTVGQPYNTHEMIITKGLKAGEEIVTSGQIKLQNNSPIAINNAGQDAKTAMVAGAAS